MTTIASNLQAIQDTIPRVARQHHRSADKINLLAVSKTFPASAIELAYHGGQTDFGENYLQEAQQKIEQLKHLPLCWHFIGPLQSNKTRPVAELFDWVHSVDRVKIAQRLSQQRDDQLTPLNICLQVNLSQESSKSGFNCDELLPAARQIAQLPNLRLRGLMAIPAPSHSQSEQHQNFAQLRQLREQLNQYQLKLDTLSMGMSQDYEAAIAEGATIVRIGSAIFGSRNYKSG